MATNTLTLPPGQQVTTLVRRRDWHCTRCFKLLGKREGEHVHLRFTRGHEYIAAMPVTAICRGCGTLNALRSTNRT